MFSVKEILFLTLVLLQTLNSYAQSVKISKLLTELTSLTKSHELALQQQSITLLELVNTKKLLNVPTLPPAKETLSVVEYSLNHPAEIILLCGLTTLGCYFVYTVIVPVFLKTLSNGLESILFFSTTGYVPPGSVARLPKYDHSVNIDFNAVDLDVIDIDVDLTP